MKLLSYFSDKTETLPTFTTPLQSFSMLAGGGKWVLTGNNLNSFSVLGAYFIQSNSSQEQSVPVLYGYAEPNSRSVEQILFCKSELIYPRQLPCEIVFRLSGFTLIIVVMYHMMFRINLLDDSMRRG